MSVKVHVYTERKSLNNCLSLWNNFGKSNNFRVVDWQAEDLGTWYSVGSMTVLFHALGRGVFVPEKPLIHWIDSTYAKEDNWP